MFLFNRKIKFANKAGAEIVAACGKTTNLNSCHLFNPMAYPDSTWLLDIESRPDRMTSVIYPPPKKAHCK